MRAARHTSAIRPRLIAPVLSVLSVGLLVAVLLSGCSVRIIDPAAEKSSPSRAESPTPSPPAQLPDAPDDPTQEESDTPGLTPTHTAERDRLIAAATTTMPCPDGPLDQDGAIIRIEGPCAHLVIDIDAGVVIADDVNELELRGSGSVVYAETIGRATVTGSANQMYWTGATPVVVDSGSANSLGRG